MLDITRHSAILIFAQPSASTPPRIHVSYLVCRQPITVFLDEQGIISKQFGLSVGDHVPHRNQYIFNVLTLLVHMPDFWVGMRPTVNFSISVVAEAILPQHLNRKRVMKLWKCMLDLLYKLAQVIRYLSFFDAPHNPQRL